MTIICNCECEVCKIISNFGLPIKLFMKKLLFIIIFSLAGIVFPLSAQADTDNIAPHPRLLLRSGDITRMRTFAASRERAQTIHQQIMDRADAILATTPITQDMLGKSDLAASDELAQRIFHLSYAFMMTEKREYSQRAEREMLAVGTFKEWNTQCVEEVATITQALAVGYDWLYHALPVHSRSIIGTAIYEKGLRHITTPKTLDDRCLTGFTYGALAIRERAPELCGEIIGEALNRCSTLDARSVAHSAHNLATAIAVATEKTMLVAALKSALTEDAAVQKSQDFMRTAEFLDFMVTPAGMAYNPTGLPSQAAVIPVKYWFARESDDSSLVRADEKLLAEGGTLSDTDRLLYMIFAPTVDFGKSAKRTNKWVAEGDTPLYIYRSGWDSPTDTHFVLDNGSFSYAWNGIHWATFVGSRPNSEGRQTLTAHNTNSSHKSVTADMSALYAPHTKRATRRAELDKKGHLTITDSFVASDQPADIEWYLVTEATAEAVGPAAIRLTHNGEELFIKMRCKGRASTKIWEEEGVQYAGFLIEPKANQTIDIEVEISPARSTLINRIGEKLKGSKQND